MKISEMIRALDDLQEEHGDMEVFVPTSQSMIPGYSPIDPECFVPSRSHAYGNNKKVLFLNPTDDTERPDA